MDIDEQHRQMELRVSAAYRAEHEAKTPEQREAARRARIAVETEYAYFLRDCGCV